MFTFALALSYHLGGEEYDLNQIHPHVRYTYEEDYLFGLYYNSDYEVSPYAAIKVNDIAEIGLVGGYGDTVYPYMRIIKDGFFVAPAIYDDGEESGLVVGYEVGF
jgi:hypothetical protein